MNEIKNIKNTNRIIQLTRSSVFKEGEDDLDWRHIIKYIYTEDDEAKKSKPDNYLAFQDSSMSTPYDCTVVSDEIDLLLSDEIGVATDNDYTGIADAIDGGIAGVKDRAESIINMLGPKARVYAQAASMITELVGTGAKVATDIYDVAKAFSAANDGNSTGMSFSPWYENLSGWSGALSSIKFEYTFKFAMGQYGIWNAEEEVFKPALNLLAAALPRHMSSLGISGPFPSSLTLINKGVMAMGANAGARLFDNKVGMWLIDHGWVQTSPQKDWYASQDEKKLAQEDFKQRVIDSRDSLTNVLKNTVGPFTFNMKFGNFFEFRNVRINDVTLTFSPELDQFGFPINAAAAVRFETSMPAVLSSTGEDAMGIRFGKLTKR